MNDFDKNLVPNNIKLERGIGSEFWLPTQFYDEKIKNNIDDILPKGKKLFTMSGREAITQIIKSLKFKKEEKIFLPSYLCESVLNPFQKKSIKTIFYKIKNNLEIDLNDIIEKIDNNTKAILIIHYFGFLQPINIMKELKNKLFVIEDITHSILSANPGKTSGSIGDISFASFRKLLPIPDGAVISYNNENIKIPKLAKVDLSHMWYTNFRELGMYYRGNFIRNGDAFSKKISQIYFQKSEELLEEIYQNPCNISKISMTIFNKLNIKEIIKQRRENFLNIQKFNNHIIKPIFPKLKKGICPLGFPILSNNRNELRDYLIKNKIYPPIHWNLPNIINKDEFKVSWEISNKELTIPIDHRYNKFHLNYIKKILENWNN